MLTPVPFYYEGEGSAGKPFRTMVVQFAHPAKTMVGKSLNYTGQSRYICQMQVDDALVEKLAGLSMLQFEEAEKEEIKADLQKMIGFIDKLQALDTTGIEPLMHMSDEVNVLREDIVGNMLSREEAFINAPHHDNNYFKVPKVIKK